MLHYLLIFFTFLANIHSCCWGLIIEGCGAALRLCPHPAWRQRQGGGWGRRGRRWRRGRRRGKEGGKEPLEQSPPACSSSPGAAVPVVEAERGGEGRQRRKRQPLVRRVANKEKDFQQRGVERLAGCPSSEHGPQSISKKLKLNKKKTTEAQRRRWGLEDARKGLNPSGFEGEKGSALARPVCKQW